MLWIGAIFGALFGWIGILAAALFWVTLAIFKLIWAVMVFGFQLILWTGAFMAKLIEYVAIRSKGTASRVPEGLTPKRTRRKR